THTHCILLCQHSAHKNTSSESQPFPFSRSHPHTDTDTHTHTHTHTHTVHISLQILHPHDTGCVVCIGVCVYKGPVCVCVYIYVCEFLSVLDRKRTRLHYS